MPAVLPHVGAALVATCIALALTRRFSSQQTIQVTIAIVIFVAMLVPLVTFSGSHYFRVLTGDLSIVSMIWLSAVLVHVLLKNERKVELPELYSMLVVIAAALFLYPTALGLSPFDSYSLGFTPIYLGAVSFCLFAAAIWFNAWIQAIAIAIALIAYQFRLLESNNLWDYLIDPILLIYCFSLVLKNHQQFTSALHSH